MKDDISRVSRVFVSYFMWIWGFHFFFLSSLFFHPAPRIYARAVATRISLRETAGARRMLRRFDARDLPLIHYLIDPKLTDGNSI